MEGKRGKVRDKEEKGPPVIALHKSVRKFDLSRDDRGVLVLR